MLPLHGAAWGQAAGRTTAAGAQAAAAAAASVAAAARQRRALAALASRRMCTGRPGCSATSPPTAWAPCTPARSSSAPSGISRGWRTRSRPVGWGGTCPGAPPAPPRLAPKPACCQHHPAESPQQAGAAFNLQPRCGHCHRLGRQQDGAVPHGGWRLAAGNFKPLKEWLNKKIHRLGSLHASGDELMTAVTGAPLQVGAFVGGGGAAAAARAGRWGVPRWSHAWLWCGVCKRSPRSSWSTCAASTPRSTP